MNYRSILYLASGSRMRQELLKLAQIPFTTILQTADESQCDWSGSPLKLVKNLARCKMNESIIPSDAPELCYVLTADTVCVDIAGKIHGKPKSATEARLMLELWTEGSTVITGFCLDKKKRMPTCWETVERVENTVSTEIDFSIPREWRTEYLKQTPAMDCAGAMAIEEYGFQFVKTIHGSYSNIIGLPLFEVRTALTKLDFFIFNEDDA